MNLTGLFLVALGILLIVIGWRGTQGAVWSSLTGSSSQATTQATTKKTGYV